MRRAQIKMGETIGILVIFFLLMVFGFGFFGSVERTNVKKAETKGFELRTIEVAQRVLFLSELQCTEEESVDIDCYDLLKVEEFYAIAADEGGPKYDGDVKLHYFTIFGKSKITLTQVYPLDFVNGDATTGIGTWDLYDNFDTRYTRKLVTNIPVSIFDPISNSYSFGYIQVEVAQ